MAKGRANKAMVFTRVGMVLVSISGGSLCAQNSFPCQRWPCDLDATSMARTYDGRIYFSFPNYDVYVSGGPATIAGGFPGADAGIGLIYRHETGMRWSGGNFLDHPAYHQELVTRYYYGNRVIEADRISAAPCAARRCGATMSHAVTANPSVLAPRIATDRRYVPPAESPLRLHLQPWVVLESAPIKPTPSAPYAPARAEPTSQATAGTCSWSCCAHNPVLRCGNAGCYCN